MRSVTSNCSFVGKCTMFLKIIMVRVKIFYQSCGNSEFLYLKLRFFRGFLPRVKVFPGNT